MKFDHKRMRDILQRTFPVLKQEILNQKKALIALGLVSALVGVVPAFKSELESGFVQEINSIIRGKESRQAAQDSGTAIAQPAPASRRDLLQRRVERFAREESDPKKDWTERVALALFHDSRLWTVIVWYAVIASIGYGLGIFITFVKSHIEQRLFARLRAHAFQRVLTSNTSELPAVANVAGRLSSAIHQGASVVVSTYGVLLDSAQYIFAVITALVFVFSKNVQIGWTFIVFVLLELWLSVVQAKKLRERRQELDKTRHDLAAQTDDILAKREIILAWDQEHRYSDKIDRLTTTFANIGRALEVSEAKFRASSQAMYDAGRIVVLLLAIFVTAGNKHPLENIGDAYFLIALYYRLLDPARSLLNAYDNLKRSESVSTTFLDLLEDKSIGAAPVSPAVAKPPEVRFDHVTFGYPDWDVLRGCSFVAPAGKVTLIVGPSGAGKTTIARLLLGFWKPGEGKILIGGHDIQSFSSEQLRGLVSYVAQADHIVDDTLVDNLSWAKPEPSEAEMKAILNQLQIADVDKKIGGAARGLSVGEQQRLSLARLILDEAPIAILDEPATGFDPDLFVDILHDLPKLLRARAAKTIIVISHQTSFSSIADHAVMLTSLGSIGYEGPPAGLPAESRG